MKKTDWESHRKKIEHMIRAGRPWEAREYGLSILGHFAEEEELRLLLARVFHEMRDLPQAGLFWMTTSDQSPEALDSIDRAAEEYGERLPHALKKPLQNIRYPDEIARRIDGTVKQAGLPEGINAIGPQDFTWDGESETWESRGSSARKHAWCGKIIETTVVLLFLLIPALILLGIWFWAKKFIGWVF